MKLVDALQIMSAQPPWAGKEALAFVYSSNLHCHKYVLSQLPNPFWQDLTLPAVARKWVYVSPDAHVPGESMHAVPVSQTNGRLQSRSVA